MRIVYQVLRGILTAKVRREVKLNFMCTAKKMKWRKATRRRRRESSFKRKDEKITKRRERKKGYLGGVEGGQVQDGELFE
jgi:hypothetical protein